MQPGEPLATRLDNEPTSPRLSWESPARRGDEKCPDLKGCSVEWPEDRLQRRSKEMSIQADRKPTSWSSTSRVGVAWWRGCSSLAPRLRAAAPFLAVELWALVWTARSRGQQEGSGASDHLCAPPQACGQLPPGFFTLILGPTMGLVAGRGNRGSVLIFFGMNKIITACEREAHASVDLSFFPSFSNFSLLSQLSNIFSRHLL